MRTRTLTVTHGPNSFQPNAAQKNLVYGAGRPSGCVLSITSFTLHKKTTEISFQLALGNTIAVPSTHTKKKKNTKAFVGENKYTVDLPCL